MSTAATTPETTTAPPARTRALSPGGIATVARLELLQRRRASRWPWVLGIWVAVLAAVSTLTWMAIDRSHANAGAAMYDIITFLVLGLALLVVPSLTATSINGDREHGVLATLQTTLLTPADLVLGKLLASWVVALVFLATALPFLAWGWIAGSAGVGEALGSVAVLALVLLVVCAVGLMFSTLTARPVGSAVLTYLTIAFLTVGTVILFFLSFFLVMEQTQVKVFQLPDSAYSEGRQPSEKDCVHTTRTERVPRTDRVWGLLAANPFVVVADAAPGAADRGGADRGLGGGFTPMRAISLGVRAARAGGEVERDECYTPDHRQDVEAGLPQAGPVWPYGLAGLLLLGAFSTFVATRRVRTPMTRLPNGTRVA